MTTNPLAFGDPSTIHDSAARFDGDDATWSIAASEPRHIPPRRTSPPPTVKTTSTPTRFLPPTPENLNDTGLRTSQIEALILKFLLNMGLASGREVANQICLPFAMTQQMLFEMKDAQLIALR